MPKSARQKEKLLRILEILESETDENHRLTTEQIISKLSAYEIEAERKSIYADMNTLKDMDIDIRLSKEKSNPGWYLVTRRLEKSEILPLVDAVSCSKFITEKKSRELIKKLESFLSRYEAGALNRSVLVTNRIKTDNESIFYVVDALSEAIINKRCVNFIYCDWNVKKELVPRYNGKIYEAFPLCLTWDDEKYYLIALDEEKGEIRHYRCDKMKNVMVLDKGTTNIEAVKNFEAVNYENKTFGMYGGREEAVTLNFPESMVGVFIDRFGKEPTLRIEKDGSVTARVKVNVSPQFFGWLTGISDNIIIKGPESVKTEYLQYVKNIEKRYV